MALKKRWTEARLPKLFEWSENINIRTRREVGMEVGGSKKKHEKLKDKCRRIIEGGKLLCVTRVS